MNQVFRKIKEKRTHLKRMIERFQEFLLTLLHVHPNPSAGIRLETGHDKGDDSSFACEGL